MLNTRAATIEKPMAQYRFSRLRQIPHPIEQHDRSYVVIFSLLTTREAGDIIRSLTAQLDGKDGGKPDFAMGSGTDASKLKEVIEGYGGA